LPTPLTAGLTDTPFLSGEEHDIHRNGSSSNVFHFPPVHHDDPKLPPPLPKRSSKSFRRTSIHNRQQQHALARHSGRNATQRSADAVQSPTRAATWHATRQKLAVREGRATSTPPLPVKMTARVLPTMNHDHRAVLTLLIACVSLVLIVLIF